MIALPPFTVRKYEADMKLLPLAKWKETVDDLLNNDKGYSEVLPINVLLPLQLVGRWVLVAWCLENK